MSLKVNFRVSRSLRKPRMSQTKSKNSSTPALKTAAELSVRDFLHTLDGEKFSGLHSMVIEQVEEPLFRAVLDYSNNNQSQAAKLLGISRGTLRTKLRQYQLLETSAKRGKSP